MKNQPNQVNGNSTKKSHYIKILILFELLFLLSMPLRALDFVSIVKGIILAQTNSTTTVTNGYMFNFHNETSGKSTTTNVTLTPPGKTQVTVEEDNEDFDLFQEYSTKAALDAGFPNGNYIFNFKGAAYSSVQVTLPLSGDTYPTNPRFSNFTAAQSVNPISDFTLSWSSLGLTANDFVQLTIYDCTEEDNVFITPDAMQPGALNGTATSYTIPANTLYAGLQYTAELLVVKMVGITTNTTADGNQIIAVTAYIKDIRMPLRTTGTSGDCISWEKLSYHFYFSDGSITGTNVQYSTPRSVNEYSIYFRMNDANPTNSVTFSGPAGSGLNNTQSTWYSQDMNGCSYFSPDIALTNVNVITGGVYTVSYKGVNLKFKVSNPQISQRQIFLVPEFIVDNSGILQQIRWSYKNQSGQTVPPQDFMKSVEIYAYNSSWQQLFQNWDIRPAFTNYIVTNTVVQWKDVQTVQIGFVDDMDANYLTLWAKPWGPPSLQIDSDSFFGTQGQQFYGQIMVSGGSYPYIGRIEIGYLPSGLVFDESSGIIQGVPGESGSFKINISVTDALNETTSKDIYINIAPSSFTISRPVFTNFTLVNGLPTIQFLTMPQHFYRLEMSTNLINWESAIWFVSEGNLSEPITVPSDMFRQFNSLFFRIIYGHHFNADLGVNLFASAGAINANPPYNITVNYPASITSYNLRFTAQFDPSYATMNEVKINGIQASQINFRADNGDPGTIAYYANFSDTPMIGQYFVNYKGTNFVFYFNAARINEINEHFVIPAPSITVSYGMLTAISWTYRNPTNGSLNPSASSFIDSIRIEIDDYDGNRIYDQDVDGLYSHTLSSPISLNNIGRINFSYNDFTDNHYVISFQK